MRIIGNVVYRWICRLGLDGKMPDHSTFFLPQRDEEFVGKAVVRQFKM